jgi:hypothetical protein
MIIHVTHSRTRSSVHNWEGVIGVTRTDNLTNVLVLKEVQVKSKGTIYIPTLFSSSHMLELSLS